MSEIVENQGSQARDQLANERTFLAWVRTGLGFVGLGVVVERLAEGKAGAAAIGVAFVAAGSVLLVYGLVRYRKVALLLKGGKYQTAATGPVALVALCLGLALAAAVYLVL